MQVVEIFDSIQGEGSMMGQSCTFIRTAGCNLRCSWCDTKNSWNTEQVDIGIAKIVNRCKQQMVIITGGEPCIQPYLPELVKALKDAGHYVCIETNGTLPTPPGIDWVVCSPKPPKYEVKCQLDELKFVVTEDFDFGKVALPIVQDIDVPVWLQPDGYNMPAMARKAFGIIMMYPELTNLRLGVQLHKIYNFK